MKKTIYERLLTVQSALNAPKNQRNKFGNYNYRSCEDVLEALKPLLLANDLNLVVSDEVVMVGARTYVKATCVLTAIGSPEERIHVTGWSREEEDKKGMDQSQITGASSSYARKYALNGLFLIDDGKDSDSTNDHGKSSPSPTPEPKPQKSTQPTTAKPGEKPKSLEERYTSAVRFVEKSKDKAAAVAMALDMIAKEKIPFTEEQLDKLKALATAVGAESLEVRETPKS